MKTRRTFLLGGLALPVLASAGSGGRDVWSAMSSAGQPTPGQTLGGCLNHVLFEAGATPADRFAQVFRQANVDVQGVQHDVGDFWYMNTPYGSLRKRPENLHAIAGMTLPISAFCLEIAGADLRMRIALQVDHRQGSNGSINHTVSGPVGLTEKIATALAAQANGWSEALAKTLYGVGTAEFEGKSNVRQMATPGTLEVKHEHLTTWVLTPVTSRLFGAQT